ncbi:hypothetical protein N7493_001618 [Penicillium malachiteum]|uniref:Uncharacterized protein n=1 Tax=Penicillium malachiteum TaxID=1324776 RepID=A0AAD6HUX7_9EURO|nr:hypothetical protein N7493_001618 [Penicillium malachiteum]
MEAPGPSRSIMDEDKYRTEVLQVTSAEAEQARAQQLSNEARDLGLKVPDINATAPLAASIACGMIDLSSPALSSASSTNRTSTCDGSVTPSLSLEPSSPPSAPLEQATSSLSQITLGSERVKPGSTRSLASWSTRPTSFCSSESRTINAGLGLHDGVTMKANRNSMYVVAPADNKEKEKERRRSSLKNAIGRIHFRKKRAPSAAMLPPNARVMITRSDEGEQYVFLEKPREIPTSAAGNASSPAYPSSNSSSMTDSLPKVEIPTFGPEALKRSLEDPDLQEMLNGHKMEKNRHMGFQEAALNILRDGHQTAVSEAQSKNRQLEDEKREKNESDAIRIEERQLAVEMEQQREFERAKVNSRTRIKHMEGYFRNASPPPSPAATADPSTDSLSLSIAEGTPPARRITRQQLEQLEQQYHDHENMDALHHARIKVLRERQEKRLQEAIARMETELGDLCEQHSKELAALQADQRREESSLIDSLETKKVLLRQRWNLEEAILRRQLENKNGQQYGPLPPISFCAEESEDENRI